MELKVTTLEGKEAGSVQLSDEIFGLEPRKDIIQRCVQWQLNKRQAGTHKVQGRADVWRTGKKMYKQKGTGGARHGSARVPSSAVAAVPLVRWCAPMRLRCRRRSARWRCAMRSRPRPRTAA